MANYIMVRTKTGKEILCEEVIRTSFGVRKFEEIPDVAKVPERMERGASSHIGFKKK